MGITVSDEQLRNLLNNDVPLVVLRDSIMTDWSPRKSGVQRRVIFPGSFNPLHLGHREMANCVQRMFNQDVVFELSIANVDKPNLSVTQIRKRLSQFDQEHSVYLTQASRFTEKAELFPRGRFIVGADTIIRIGDTRYYEDSTHQRDAAIEQLHDRQIRFIVFGRVINENYEAAHQLELPDRLKELCDSVSETDFRRDISSTQLREK